MSLYILTKKIIYKFLKEILQSRDNIGRKPSKLMKDDTRLTKKKCERAIIILFKRLILNKKL